MSTARLDTRILAAAFGAAALVSTGASASPLAQDHALHAHDAPAVRRAPDQHPVAKLTVPNRVVYGYLPFWSGDLSNLRWDLLTHLAWFSVDMNADGGIDAKHGWPDTVTVAAAHANDVRVDVAFTLFSGTGIKQLVSSPTRRAVAIGNMIDTMEEGGADGVSIDFEGFDDGTRDDFVTFVAELRAELDARGDVDAEITIAGPAVDWGDEWDVAALLDSADWFFIMGYEYVWSGSSHAGPSGIFRVSDAWRPVTSWSGLRSVATWSSLVGAEKRRKIIYGVPYYGREFTTTTDAMGAPTIDSVSSVTYSAARADLAAGRTRLWDDGAKTPWYVWQSGGTWHETYYEDEESLRYKAQLAIDEDIGGVGIWALGYDGSYPELWETLASTLGTVTPPAEGHRLNPVVVSTTPFHDERDTAVGPSQYFNFYSCSPDTPEYGKEWVYAIDVCQPGSLTARVAPGASGVDPDVHVLSAITEDACLARDDASATVEVEPGRYYIVVDTFVASSVEQEGPYALDVDFAAAAGTAGCPAAQRCQAGACVCDEGATACGDACVDLATDADNCGACGARCDGVCAGGVCESATASGTTGAGGATSHASSTASTGGAGGETGQGAGAGAPDDAPTVGDGGCGCRFDDAPSHSGALALAAGLGLGLVARRRRARA